MSIYKRKWKKGGETITAKNYTVEVHDKNTGKIVRRTAPTKAQAVVVQAKIRHELYDNRYDIGDKYAKARLQKLADCRKDYTGRMSDEKLDKMYVSIVDLRLARIFSEAKWVRLGDINLDSFERWRGRFAKKNTHLGKPPSGKTINQHLETLKTFLEWCVDTDRLPDNPLRRARNVKETPSNEYRRAMTQEEFTKLYLNTPDDDRKTFYYFCAYTGLRKGAVRQLKWSDVRLDTAKVVIRADISKDNRENTTDLRPDLVTMLRKYRDGRPDWARVFETVPKCSTFKKDLKRAGVDFDRNGKHRLDLHAFRKSLVEWLRANGAPLHVASKILHHKHLSTTEKYYTDKNAHGTADAMAKLPSPLDKNGRADA